MPPKKSIEEQRKRAREWAEQQSKPKRKLVEEDSEDKLEAEVDNVKPLRESSTPVRRRSTRSKDISDDVTIGSSSVSLRKSSRKTAEKTPLPSSPPKPPIKWERDDLVAEESKVPPRLHRLLSYRSSEIENETDNQDNILIREPFSDSNSTPLNTMM